MRSLRFSDHGPCRVPWNVLGADTGMLSSWQVGQSLTWASSALRTAVSEMEVDWRSISSSSCAASDLLRALECSECPSSVLSIRLSGPTRIISAGNTLSIALLGMSCHRYTDTAGTLQVVRFSRHTAKLQWHRWKPQTRLSDRHRASSDLALPAICTSRDHHDVWR